jgi:hypothetical protein
MFDETDAGREAGPKIVGTLETMASRIGVRLQRDAFLSQDAYREALLEAYLAALAALERSTKRG